MKQNGVPLPEDHSLIEPFSRSEDTLFKDVPIYDGPVAPDLSERHDDYLYGEED